MIDAGSDTTSALIQSLVLCLIKSPSSLRKAQAEVDSVVGRKRLPDSPDIKDLPYVQAMIREVRSAFI